MNVVEKRKNWENKVSWYKKMRQIQHRNLLPTVHISLMSYVKRKCFILSVPLGGNEVQKELNKESIDVCVRLYLYITNC